MLRHPHFTAATANLSAQIAHTTPSPSAASTPNLRDKHLTLAGLRGSRPAQLITQLGALNQTSDDVRHLLLTNHLNPA